MGYNQGSDSRDVSFGSEGSIFNGSESMKVEKSQPQMKTNERIRYFHQNISQHQQERGWGHVTSSQGVVPIVNPYSRAILDGEMMV
jgi:hypothetical protein